MNGIARRWGPASPVRGLVAALAALCLLSACAETPASPDEPLPQFDAGLDGSRFAGTFLTDDGQGRKVFRIELPGGEPEELPLPEADFVPTAVAVGDAAVAMVFHTGRVALYRVAPGEEPTRLAEGAHELTNLAVAGDQVVVGDCRDRTLLLIDPAGGGTRRAGGGCIGAVSPDGTMVAYARDGAVWRAPVDGSAAPVRLFTVNEIPGLDDLLPKRGRDVAEMHWGAPGLAITVQHSTQTLIRTAVVVALASGRVRVIPTLGALFVSFLRWQPQGNLLAVATGATGGEGSIRLYRPEDDSLTTIALNPRGFISAAWQPDGERLAAISGGGFFGTQGGYWSLLDLQGRQVDRFRGPGGFIYGWVP